MLFTLIHYARLIRFDTHTPHFQCQVFVLALISNARTSEGRVNEREIRIGAITAVALTGF